MRHEERLDSLVLRPRLVGQVLPELEPGFEVTAVRMTSFSARCKGGRLPTAGRELRADFRWLTGSDGHRANRLRVHGVVSGEPDAHTSADFEVRFLDLPRLLAAPESPDGERGQTPAILRPLGLNRRAFTYYTRLERVREYVLARFREPLPLARVAGIAGMDTSYFSDFFRRKAEVPFSRWLEHLRIGAALDLVHGANHSITYIAHEVGFSNLRSFERSFRRRTDMTPVTYKKWVRPS